MLLTLSGMTCESKKKSSSLGATFVTLNELGRMSKSPDWCQFSPQKNLEIFEKKKISWQNLIQKGQGDKSIPSRAK